MGCGQKWFILAWLWGAGIYVKGQVSRCLSLKFCLYLTVTPTVTPQDWAYCLLASGSIPRWKPALQVATLSHALWPKSEWAVQEHWADKRVCKSWKAARSSLGWTFSVVTLRVSLWINTEWYIWEKAGLSHTENNGLSARRCGTQSQAVILGNYLGDQQESKTSSHFREQIRNLHSAPVQICGVPMSMSSSALPTSEKMCRTGGYSEKDNKGDPRHGTAYLQAKIN